MDVNERANLAGAGLNMAQRVMDCGDAGHILLSKHVAEDLEEYQKWRPLLHDLGSCEVKHGVRVSVVNLYDDQFGNAKLPRRFETVRKRRTRLRWAATAAALLALAAIVAGITMFSASSSAISAGCSGKKHRCSSVRKPEPRSGQRLLCRRHPGGNSDAPSQDRGFESDFAHFNAALQKQRRKICRRSPGNLAWLTSWKAACKRAAMRCA